MRLNGKVEEKGGAQSISGLPREIYEVFHRGMLEACPVKFSYEHFIRRVAVQRKRISVFFCTAAL